MSNASGLKPKGRAVLIQPYKPQSSGGLIELPDDVLAREQMVEQRAIVIAVGSSAWCDEKEPRAEVGDRVLVSKFAGYQATGTADGKLYRFVNDRDIFAQIEVES